MAWRHRWETKMEISRSKSKALKTNQSRCDEKQKESSGNSNGRQDTFWDIKEVKLSEYGNLSNMRCQSRRKLWHSSLNGC